jgi:hypothetical protein
MAQIITPVSCYLDEVSAEGARTGRIFRRIIERMPGYPELVSSGLLRREMLRNVYQGGSIYAHFPFTFADALPQVRLQQLRRLSLSALFFVQHVLLSDELVDESRPPHYTGIIFSNAFQALAWQMLAKAADGCTLPWDKLVSYYREYTSAVILESRDHRKKLLPYSNEDLVRVVSRRCAVSKIISHALCWLGNRPELADRLNNSLDNYWLADSMLDDWRDWKADLKNGHYTYFLAQAICGAGSMEALSGQSEARQIEILGKHIYGSGFLLSYLQKVSDHMEAARDAVASTGCNRWQQLLGYQLLSVCSKRNFMLREIRSLRLEHEPGVYRLARRRTGNTLCQSAGGEIPDFCAPDVFTAAQMAVEFFLKSYRINVGFSDFMTPHGDAATWVSAYVGCSLREWCRFESGHDPQQRAATEEILAGLAMLLRQSYQDNGWPMNSSLPPDAETTAWVLRFLFPSGLAQSDRGLYFKVIQHLPAYQLEDGGFSKFLVKTAGQAFPGWATSHPEVTGLVVSTLAGSAAQGTEAVIQRGLNYLLRTRDGRILWRSYWWEGASYTNFYCLEALLACGTPLEDHDKKEIVDELLGCQDEDGSWGNTLRGRSAVFETAYAIKLLLGLRAGRKGWRAILRGIKWLLLHQLGDGSWTSDPMLRVPLGADLNPWKFKEWKLDSPMSYGVLLRDHQRLFTTAAVLAALVDFTKSAGDHRLTFILAVRQKPDLVNSI